jgi:RHS repeat-associated protein
VWLGDLPVAVLSAVGEQRYVGPDHLGAPHEITNASGQVVWQWDHDPFGNGQPSGTFTYGLRFPGQFYDQNAGLHYNYFRDYDPRTGRYIQSDPVGLAGGINTYSYVAQSPVNLADPTGEFAPLIIALPFIGGAIGGLADVLAAGPCESKLAAFERGFISGFTGTTIGLGTGNPFIGGAVAGATSNYLDQRISGQQLDPGSLAVSTTLGGAGGYGLWKALPTAGRLPSLWIPRNSSNIGPNTLRWVGQEAGSDIMQAGAQQYLSGNGKCGCK